MSFHANLKRLRKAAKLSQEQLAHACGFAGQSRISNYETDPSKESSREPRMDEIPIIARALGVSAGELFGESPATSQAVRLDPDILSETARTLRERDPKADWITFIERTPDRFIRAYTLYAERTTDHLSDEEMRKLAMKIADLTPQGASKDERTEKVPAKGTTERRVGQGGKRKT